MKHFILFCMLSTLISFSYAQPPVTDTQNSFFTNYFLKAKYFIMTKYMLEHPAPFNPAAIQYWVDYSPLSRVKDVPLKNARFTVQIYYNGNPTGRFEVTTDDLQHFSFDKFKDPTEVGLEVLSINGQANYHAQCNGYARPKQHSILISCD